MTWADLPPLTALRAFAALAETGSYSRAGAALNVTHAAVIQQVRALEARLGVSLATRTGRGVELTAEGAALARELDTGFAAIRRGVEALTGAAAQRPVQVTTSPAFAARWLMPRINDFQSRHPEITLLMNPTAQVVELKPGGTDVALRYHPVTRAPAKVEKLLDVDLVVVGARALIGERPVARPEELVHLPWLQELGTNEVAEWFARRGVALDRPLMISHMPGNLIMDTLRRGDGISYVVRQLVRDGLDSGELVELFAEEGFGAFHIHTQPGVLRRPVKTFLGWLREQAGG